MSYGAAGVVDDFLVVAGVGDEVGGLQAFGGQLLQEGGDLAALAEVARGGEGAGGDERHLEGQLRDERGDEVVAVTSPGSSFGIA